MWMKMWKKRTLMRIVITTPVTNGTALSQCRLHVGLFLLLLSVAYSLSRSSSSIASNERHNKKFAVHFELQRRIQMGSRGTRPPFHSCNIFFMSHYSFNDDYSVKWIDTLVVTISWVSHVSTIHWKYTSINYRERCLPTSSSNAAEIRDIAALRTSPSL